MMDDDLWISWEKQEDVDTYRILVYDVATEELLTDEIVTEETQWFGEIPQSTDSLKAAVAAYRWGHTGDFELYSVTRGDFDGVSVTFPVGDSAGSVSGASCSGNGGFVDFGKKEGQAALRLVQQP